MPGSSPLPRAPLPEGLARAAGALLRAVHDAGLQACDLHPGNLVADGDGRLHLVDLTSARFGASLETEPRARALAFFLLDLDGGPHHPSAAPLLASYGASALLRARVASRWRGMARAAVRAFGRRALRACRHTAVRKAPGVAVFEHRPAGELAAAAVAAEPALAGIAPHKHGRRGGVWLLDAIVAKRRQPAAARRLFRASYWLLRAGVPAPEPLALVLRRGVGTVLVRREVGPDLRTLLLGHALAPDELRATARALGGAVGRLHAHGLRNRDLKLENLVLRPATGEVAMVDLDGVRRNAPSDRRGVAADLGRLLAAFRAAGAPGGTSSIAAFARGYNRARQCLGHIRLDPFTRRLTAVRASGLARPSPSTSGS